jgi:hypothetical protein
MKSFSRLISLPLVVIVPFFYGHASAQDQPVHPNKIKNGTYLGLSLPLRDLPKITMAEIKEMELRYKENPLNEWPAPTYPFKATAQPQGNDPIWQAAMGNMSNLAATVINFAGQSGNADPLDPNGVVGPNHYMQTINSVYAIYNKTGTLLAGPTDLNLLFGNLLGTNCNDGDPIMLYDEQANRYLCAEFSLCNPNDRMLIAISQTNDPTGSWHRYSFDVDDVPDYMKFGIWRDAYYMGTNTHAVGSDDIYAFDRSQMLNGNNAQMVSFDNPWRPATYQGVQCALPVDNDGEFAPIGTPGNFLILNNDAIAGGTDQLWIFEMAVDCITPANSTFNRVQQLNVPAFDSDFGSNWDNIAQYGTAQELLSVSDLIMNVPQFRNFSGQQSIVLCHTVDVNNTDRAGMRWYELLRTSGSWSIRQSGTYSPDANSRWMGSIHMNGHKEIGLAYSISSSSMYPGIRYCGQDAIEYAKASGAMNVAEATIQTGAYSKTWGNRWGDYSSLFVDPVDDRTFWYTQMFEGAVTQETRIAAFTIYPSSIYVDKTAALGGNGTLASPIRTVTQALGALGPGTNVYIKSNTYDEANPMLINQNGLWNSYNGASIVK